MEQSNVIAASFYRGFSNTAHTLNWMFVCLVHEDSTIYLLQYSHTMTRTWVPLAGDIWAFSASEILNEQASEEHAHPLMTSDMPLVHTMTRTWVPLAGDIWAFSASEILNEQASEEHAHPLMTSDILLAWTPFPGTWIEGASTTLEEQAF
ncbi:hypothetical protein HD554DRAFT_2058408 [Boletus coccyginus]|nr:hypothetical protein HD554DRAFT_2058408 [Boletus coccyginus]